MTIAVVWFRQDLRSEDNPAFAAACNNHHTVIPLYILDEHVRGAQKWWLHHSLIALEKKLRQYKLPLVLRKGNPLDILTKIIREHNVDTVYWNRCYEPASIARDKVIKKAIKESLDIDVISSNGSLLVEPWKIKNKSGDYFKVFTPFWNHCLGKIVPSEPITIHECPQSLSIKSDQLDDWDLLPKKINWASEFSTYWQPGEDGAHKKLHTFIHHHLDGYKETRNFPAQQATSGLSPHLHFGEISPRQVHRAVELAKLDPQTDLASAENFLSEIGWREFSYHLLYHFPELPTTNFKTQFDHFRWNNDADHLKRWQQGLTGYPIVDAGMRELWKTGIMHNRVRMIVASFLTKDLLIDWRKGADWFLDTLLDADLANNSASWQWVAGSGADAAPYFRIFNPVLQGEKFDPKGEYIRRWVPELASVSDKWIHQPWRAPDHELGIYPPPIIDHNQARSIALMNYQKIKQGRETP